MWVPFPESLPISKFLTMALLFFKGKLKYAFKFKSEGYEERIRWTKSQISKKWNLAGRPLVGIQGSYIRPRT